MKQKHDTGHFHFIGIGGIGMSGLARILLSRNVPVSGSDIASSYVTEGLQKAGAKVSIGHAANNIASNMTIVYSTDIKKNNPEFEEALRLQCPLMHRSDLLQNLMIGYKTLAVAGTHGKTTTSSLLTATLASGGVDPSFAVGGIIPQFQSNAGNGQGEYFVAEADESDGTFLKYDPFGAIITNIDLDHMDHFISEAALHQAFAQFANKVQSTKHLFWCGDDKRLKSLSLPGISYGFGKSCDLRVEQYTQNGWSLKMDILFHNTLYKQVEIALIGRHNVLNALAVFGMALTLGIKEEAIRKAFSSFGGVKRRCEKKGEVKNILFLDDYAHHPTEIKTTLEGLRQTVGKKRLIAIFQPHRYSRTQNCLGSFGGIFNSVDELIITDIFGSNETPIPGLTSEVIIKEITSNVTFAIKYIPRQELRQKVAALLRPNDVVVTLGAGDITKLGLELVNELEKT